MPCGAPVSVSNILWSTSDLVVAAGDNWRVQCVKSVEEQIYFAGFVHNALTSFVASWTTTSDGCHPTVDLSCCSAGALSCICL